MTHKIIICFAIILMSLQACSSGNNSPVSGSEAANTEASDPQKQLCGGFSEERELTDEDIVIFRSVISDESITPVRVSTQVVAGLNYRFRCSTPEGEVFITIYRDLQGNLQLLDR